MTTKWMRLGAVLATLLWLWGASAPIAEARRGGGGRGGGFGGFRSSPRSSGGGGGGLFGGFRRQPRSSEGSGGLFGGFRRSPRPADPAPPTPPAGGFGGFGRRGPVAPGPAASPGLATAPSSTPGAAAAPGAKPSSSIASPLPSAAPAAGAGAAATATTPGRLPGAGDAASGSPSSIASPMPSARPGAPASSGAKFSTRNQRGPGTTLPAPVGGTRYPNYRPGFGGVMVPPGMGWWGFAPYHWLWWAGMPSPYGYGMPGRHASVLGTIMGMLFLFGLAALVVVGIAWYVRRQRRAARSYEREAIRETSERLLTREPGSPP